MVIEALDDVEVLVRRNICNDIEFPRLAFRGSILRIDWMEGEEWIGFVGADQALTLQTINHKPGIFFLELNSVASSMFLAQRIFSPFLA